MEIRVYCNSMDYASRKTALVKRVDMFTDILFPFDSTIRTMKALYGEQSVIEFICL